MSGAQVVDWLSARRPERPSALAERMAEWIGAREPAPSAGMADALAGYGLMALKGVTDGTRADRLALDLLAADAFVTYAFEAAAEDGVDVAPLVARLLAEAA